MRRYYLFIPENLVQSRIHDSLGLQAFDLALASSHVCQELSKVP